MAVETTNGGLILWQAGIATPLGRFQFVLGCEVGVALYGLLDDDRLIIPPPGPGAGSALVDLRSIRVDFPVLAYRPFRIFSQDQSTSLVVQLFAGFEVPTAASVVAPAGASEPDLTPLWQAGLRLAFDWRYYLGALGKRGAGGRGH
jgi:hypothetical protein